SIVLKFMGIFPLSLNKDYLMVVKRQKQSEPKPEQRIAFQYFLQNQKSCVKRILAFLHGEYERLLPNAPEWFKQRDLKQLVRGNGVDITSYSKGNEAYYGISFDGAWDPEHGLAVLSHHDKVIKIGDFEMLSGTENPEEQERSIHDQL